MNEATLQQSIMALARLLHWSSYHTYDSRKSASGWPDLVLVGHRILYRELKSETGVVTPDQKVWLSRLRFAGADADVWRPEDWPARITAELKDEPVPARALPWTLTEALAEQRAALVAAERKKLAARVPR